MAPSNAANEVFNASIAILTLLLVLVFILSGNNAKAGGSSPSLRRSAVHLILSLAVAVSFLVELLLRLLEQSTGQGVAQRVAMGLFGFSWVLLGARRRHSAWMIYGLCTLSSVYDAGTLIIYAIDGTEAQRQWVPVLVIASTRLLCISCLFALGLRVSLRRPKANKQLMHSRLVIASTRLLCISCLFALGLRVSLRRPSHAIDSKQSIYSDSEDETRPLIQADSLLERESSSSGSTLQDEDWSSDEDDAEDSKTRITRLRDEGDWTTYLAKFRIFLPLLVPELWSHVTACFVASVLCLVGKRFLNVLIPAQLGVIVDKLSANYIPQQELLIYLALCLLYDDCGLGVIQSLAKLPIERFSYSQLTNAAFAHVMSLSMDFHSEQDSAEVMKAVSQGEALTNVLDTAILEMAPTVVDTFVAFVLLYVKFDATIALCMAFSAASFFAVEAFSSSLNKGRRRLMTKAEREEARIMHQATQGWHTVALFNMFSFERLRFGQAVDKKMQAKIDWIKADTYLSALAEALVPCTFFVLGSLIARKVHAGEARAGDFVFFVQYWEMLVFPIRVLSHEYRYLTANLVDAERLLDLLTTEASIVDKDGAVSLPLAKGRVEFAHVDFSYGEEADIGGLHDICISAAPGEHIALVGTTGAGKSTLTKLLLRFYDIDAGSISIDGCDVRDATLESIRAAIGVVPQAPLLFNTTIMENLRYAKLSATDDEIYAACKAAAIHDQILSLPNGYNTKVGEHGMKLSGGEAQRLAIARVILKDPRILILDEATSAVDTKTESEIQAALRKIMESRTTFVVAHRLATIVKADQILVLHEGRIVERGTHRELVERGGRYGELWANQTGRVEEKEALIVV